MGGRQCKEMLAALAAYDRRKPGVSVRTIAEKHGVSHTGLYAAIRARFAASEIMRDVERLNKRRGK